LLHPELVLVRAPLSVIHRFGRFELRPDARLLLADGKPVEIGARAFDVLHALVERRDRVVTKDELLDLAWPGVIVEENNLHVQVSTLRKVLGPDAIKTIRAAVIGSRSTMGRWSSQTVQPPTFMLANRSRGC
jgi:DNA-binding response OmpR family regulator